MNPLGRLLTPVEEEDSDRPCGSGGAGARLGSPVTPGVLDEARGARDEPAVSPLESGSVGFLRDAMQSVRFLFIKASGLTYPLYSDPWLKRPLANARQNQKQATCSFGIVL